MTKHTKFFKSSLSLETPIAKYSVISEVATILFLLVIPSFVVGSSLSVSATSATSGGTWGPVIDVSPGPNPARDLELAVSGSNVYTFWMETTQHIPRIFLSASHDNGATFGPAVNISGSKAVGLYTVSAVGSNVYILWISNGFFFSVSHDYGKTFTTKLVSSLYPLGNFGMSDTNSNVYLAWTPYGTSKVFFTASNDNGRTFSTPMLFSSSASFSSLSAVGTKMYFSYKEGSSILLITSMDSGHTFSKPLTVFTSNDIQTTAVTGAGNQVYVSVINAYINSQTLLLFSSSDNGKSFLPPVVIGTNLTYGDFGYYSIIAASNNVYAAWTMLSNVSYGYYQILFRQSSNYGASFGPIINLSQNCCFASSGPELAVSGNNVYAAWSRVAYFHQGGCVYTCIDDFFRQSSDNGKTFGPMVDVTGNTGASNGLGQMASSGDDVYFLYTYTPPYPKRGAQDAFFRVLT